jgi:NAD+ diphosphatase
MREPQIVDRAAHLRADTAWLRAAWENPASKVMVVAGGRTLVAGDRLVWTTPAVAPPGERFFLGTSTGERGGYFAVAADLPQPPPEGARAASLRDVGAQLSAAEVGLLAHAAALEQWHARHTFCHLCGAATVVEMGGHIRRCVADGSEHYPRTDPAVIMLVTDDDDRALLGHQPSWPHGRMSTLAGYVEAGETLEQAVAREVAEEVGIGVDDICYVRSQPWPFPASLMLAFTARATGTELAPDGVEITEARWFSRDEMIDAVRDGSLKLPMPASVAFFLVDRWFGGGLAEAVSAQP